MNLLRLLSIKSKLILLAAASVGVALLIVSLGLSSNVVRSIRRAELESMQSQARVLAANSVGALKSGDREAAARLLLALQCEPSIDAARLYDARQQPLASYMRDGVNAQPPRSATSAGARFTENGEMEITQPVMNGDAIVGMLAVRANTDAVQNQLADYRQIAIIVMLAAIAAATLTAMLLQVGILGPIRRLHEAVSRIGAGDYTIRVADATADEFGDVRRGLDVITARIEASSKELNTARDDFEERVAQRTHQLQTEIDQREIVRRDLERAKDAAESASRAKSQFLANLSHEIRTPLNGILGYTHLLRKRSRDDVPSQEAEYLKTIEVSGRHLLTVINDVLDISKIEAGQLSVEEVECDPQRVIVDVMSLLRVKAQEKGLRLDYFWGTRAPQTIRSDPARLRQMLMNLVGNAIKFTDHGGVQVVARLEDAAQDEAAVSIEVSDTGVGIAAAKLKRIFDPFFQVDTSMTRRFGGAGLGLAITRRLARALGGDLKVASTEGRGSTFTVSVAAGMRDELQLTDAVNAEAVDRSDRIPVGIRLDGVRVLVVEDGDTNRELVGIVLTEAGAHVAIAENGLLGVQAVQTGQYDVVLMDMQMPVMDGYTATRTLRLEGCALPIIALTAHAMSGDERKCLEAGCTGYLTKPINPDELLADLAELLALPGRPAEPQAESPSSESGELERPADGPTLTSTLPDKPAFRRIVDLFTARVTERTKLMRTAFLQQDWLELATLAHWLKGSGGSAGFEDFTRVAGELEEHAKAEEVEHAQISLERIDALVRRLPPAIST